MDPKNNIPDPDFRKGDDARERDELERLAPTLFSIPKEDPFKVPAHFFDQLPHAVQTRVVEGERKSAFPWSWRIAIATPMVAVLIGALWFLRDRTNIPITDMATSTAPIEEVDVLEEDDLYFEAASDGGMSLDAIGSELTDDELLTYLEQEHTDLNELISEL